MLFRINPFTNKLDETSISGGGGGGNANTQVFTYTGSPQTYTRPPYLKYCIVECVGGGGAGGGAYGGSAGSGITAGGGAGGYARKTLSAAAIGASQTVTVGAGGIGIVNSTGGTGGTTAFGALFSSTGGFGGDVGDFGMADYNCPGGLGGQGLGGDFNTVGNPGESTVANQSLIAGNGGSSFFGGSALGPFGYTGSSSPGVAGTSYGGGASGMYNLNTDSAGANGAPGVVIVTEFI